MKETRTPATRSKRTFDARIKDARIGDVAAQYDVGLMYANGNGVERNVEEALVWFKVAAKKGHPGAQYLLASAFANGVGTAKDELAALEWYLKAANQGNTRSFVKLARLMDASHDMLAHQCNLQAAQKGLPEAQLAVGRHGLRGHVAGGPEAARDWFQKAADQGQASARYELGQLMLRGEGGAADLEQARACFRAAAAQGHAASQVMLAKLDERGSGLGDESARRARRAGGKERRRSDQRWTRAAEEGDADDRYHLGLLLETGNAVKQDLTQARYWYQRAAEQAHVPAQLALARMLESTDPVAAAIWYEKAATRGDASAQSALGRLHQSGQGVPFDLLKSLQWYAAAAVQRHGDGLLALGQWMEASEPLAALSCFELAAQDGLPEAQWRMGIACLSGAHLEKDEQKAVHWLQLAAQQGHAQAQCALGDVHAKGVEGRVNVLEAAHWYEKAARNHVPKAQWRLGGLLATGGGGLQPDPKQASSWCKKAANAGYAPAQATLGTLFATARKYDRAVEWWEKATRQGDPEALFNLAQALIAGRGVGVDLARAFALMEEAAINGVPAAQARLGMMYAAGEGVAVDPIEASKWFCLASAAGDASATANLSRAQAMFSPAQLAEALRRVEVWKATSENRR